MEWQSLEVPNEAARVRLLPGLACRALGDHDASHHGRIVAKTVTGSLRPALEKPRELLRNRFRILKLQEMPDALDRAFFQLRDP